MYELSYEEIDNCCLSIINYININHTQYSSHIMFMYLFGCRIGELFDYRINFNTLEDQVEIIAQKGNDLRIEKVYPMIAPELITNILLTQDNFWINKRNLQRIIEVAKPYRNLYCGNKKIGAHLFRHNWVKKQVSNGKQIETINSMLGYTNQTITDTYLPSVIRYKN